MKKYAFLFLLSFILISCESEEVAVDEEHTDADGFILEYNEEEVYKEFSGAIVTNNITVSIGQEIELAVHFLDDEGNEIEHSDDDDHDHDHSDDEDHDEEGSPEIVISGNDAAIAIVSTEHHEDDHDDEDHDDEEDHEEHKEGYMVAITGVSAGSTSFTLTLMHDGHADYTSTNPVAITVTADSTLTSN